MQNKIDDQKPVIANKMQEKALEGIKKIIDEKGKRALVCSATGTGKTILLALHVKEFKPKRFYLLSIENKFVMLQLENLKGAWQKY